MVHIPAVDRLEHKKYVWEVGGSVNVVTLWIRFQDREEMEYEYNTAEYPIYQNTRGLSAWMATDSDWTDYNKEEPSEEFWKALDKIRDSDWHGEISTDECRWYEAEALDALYNVVMDTGEYSDEMTELITYAQRQVRDPNDCD